LVAGLPGVEAAAAVNTLPLTGFNALRPHQLPGATPDERKAEFRIVTVSAALAGVLDALLFGVAPLDPPTFAAVSLMTVGASLIASAMPALRATRVDPNVVLRAE
jgi:ABC-type antimicrobial peptide transport system permease subunit